MTAQHLLHITHDGMAIYCEYPKQSHDPIRDFKLAYCKAATVTTTLNELNILAPLNWTVDLLIKMQHQKRLTKSFIDHLLNMLNALQPLTAFPPKLQFFRPEHIERFLKLDKYGDYSVEFLLVVIELIMLQELTNYPAGSVNRRLLEAIREGKDIFTIVARATQVRRGT